MASKKKTASKKAPAARKSAKCHPDHPNCHAHHGRAAECPRTGAPGRECARIGPEGRDEDGNPTPGKPCGAVSQPEATFCHHCRQPF